VSDCDIDAAKCRCRVCGASVSAPHVRRNCRPGLGDRVHDTLAAVGITPERVASVLGVDDCGCEGRRQWLNEAGIALGIGSPPELTGGADSPQS
jgi:hypothetical protein